jgi:hypothetical protein
MIMQGLVLPCSIDTRTAGRLKNRVLQQDCALPVVVQRLLLGRRRYHVLAASAKRAARARVQAPPETRA